MPYPGIVVFHAGCNWQLLSICTAPWLTLQLSGSSFPAQRGALESFPPPALVVPPSTPCFQQVCYAILEQSLFVVLLLHPSSIQILLQLQRISQCLSTLTSAWTRMDRPPGVLKD